MKNKLKKHDSGNPVQIQNKKCGRRILYNPGLNQRNTVWKLRKFSLHSDEITKFTLHTVEKWKIYFLRKEISSNKIFSVPLVKSLLSNFSKKRESEFP